jgi:hypothetical protein
MIGACSTYGESRGYTAFWRGNPRERYKFGELGTDGKIILRWIVMNWEIGV